MKIVLSLALVAGVFFGILPEIADFSKVWAAIVNMSWVEVGSLLVAGAWNIATYQFVVIAVLPGLSYWQAFVVGQSSTAISTTLPAGSALGVGVTYSMHSAWGRSGPEIALAAVLTGVWNNLHQARPSHSRSRRPGHTRKDGQRSDRSGGNRRAGIDRRGGAVRSDAAEQRVRIDDRIGSWKSCLTPPCGGAQAAGRLLGRRRSQVQGGRHRSVASPLVAVDGGHRGQPSLALLRPAARPAAHGCHEPAGRLGRGTGRLRPHTSGTALPVTLGALASSNWA